MCVLTIVGLHLDVVREDREQKGKRERERTAKKMLDVAGTRDKNAHFVFTLELALSATYHLGR
jgi:hypothetical protein